MLTAQYPKALLLEGCQLWYTGNTLVDQIPVLFPSDLHVTWPKVKVSLLVFIPNVYKESCKNCYSFCPQRSIVPYCFSCQVVKGQIAGLLINIDHSISKDRFFFLQLLIFNTEITPKEVITPIDFQAMWLKVKVKLLVSIPNVECSISFDLFA